MEKGILILLGTFIVVAILHLVSMKMTKISEAKKTSFRKVFFYIYGVFLILSGILQCIEKNEIRVVFLLVLERVASRNHSNYCVSEKHK